LNRVLTVATPFRDCGLDFRRQRTDARHFVTPIPNLPLQAAVGEYGYSEDLRLNMLAIHKDPRAGEQTAAVTQVNRGDPDPAIFEASSGYKVIRRGAQ
jgi:hypothetical protein